MKRVLKWAAVAIPAAWVAASFFDIWAGQGAGGSDAAWNLFNLLIKLGSAIN